MSSKQSIQILLAALLVFVALFLLLAYLQFDPKHYTQGLRGVNAHPFGVLGAGISVLSFKLFGLASFAFPLFLAAEAWFVLRMLARRCQRDFTSWYIQVGILFFLICLFVEVFSSKYFPDHEPIFGFGGWLGAHVGHAFQSLIGAHGTLLFVGIAGGMTLVWMLSHLRLPRFFFWKDLALELKNFIDPPEMRQAEEDYIHAALLKGIAESRKNNSKTVKEMESQAIQKEQDKKKLVLDLGPGPSAHGLVLPKLFSASTKPEKTPNIEKFGQKLASELKKFGIEGTMRSAKMGPVVTTYEFEPKAGTKISKLLALEEDIARMLSADSMRILAPIPGKNTVGFEVPNNKRAIVGFKELLEDYAIQSSQKVKLPIAMGVDVYGKPMIEDLASMPHLLVAGSTGSGKSVFINALILSLIAKHKAKDLRMIMVDPKMVELSVYANLPHLACPVVTDPANEVTQVLGGLVDEMEQRFVWMQQLGARNIENYNKIIRSKRKSSFQHFKGKWQPLPFIVLIIDEMADMMMMLGREAEIPITRLAQKARACGIHLVIATQRPSADVVTGLIKTNFPTRVAFRVLSGIDSRTILDQNGAEQLLGKGDMMYLNAQGLLRLHGAFIEDEEVISAVKSSRK